VHDLDTHPDQHPEIALLMRQQAIAQADADLAQRSRRPDWNVELMLGQRGPAYSTMVSVGVSIPLQIDLRNRQDRELSARLALVEQARAQREDATREHLTETRLRFLAWQGNQARLAHYDRTLLPLAAAGLLQDEAHVTAVTGSTGAGVKPSATTHFSWRSDNISVYKAFTHQHLLEIGRNLRLLEPSFDREVNFVPMRGDFTRGILASVYTACPLDGEAASKLYADFYAPSAFTRVTERDVDLKQVVNTNKALLHTAKYGGKLHVVSVIDNLLKGASGQAVQNMNLMFGLDEKEGLRLKASAF
jgi:N-acetyl-gamma-glutamyl-phosphate reductase